MRVVTALCRVVFNDVPWFVICEAGTDRFRDSDRGSEFALVIRMRPSSERCRNPLKAAQIVVTR